MNIRKILLGLLLLVVSFIGIIVIMMNSTGFLKSPIPVRRNRWSIEEKNNRAWRKHIREIMEPVFSPEEISNFQSLVLAFYVAIDNLRKAEDRCAEERFSGLQRMLHRYLPAVCGSPIYNWFYPDSLRQEAIKSCTSSEYKVARSECDRLKGEALQAEKMMFESEKWKAYVASLQQE